MHMPGFLQLIVVLLLVVLLFGRGRISDVMGDVAKGIRSFRKGLSEENDAPRAEVLPPEKKDT